MAHGTTEYRPAGGRMEANRDLDRVYCFGGFRLLPAHRRLFRGDEAVPLGPKALNVLIVLVERHGRIVSTDEILDLAWPGVFVGPANVAVQILGLRKLLGRAAITTIPGRGYRFVAALEQAEYADVGQTNPAPEPDRTRASTNLPQLVASVIGRELDLADLASRLHHHRLVTLVGPGGIGKTRLAIELGRNVSSLFPDGVWLIDLAPLALPSLITSATATVLGVELRGTDAPIEGIAAAIRARRLLLIFDNSEYLLDAVTEVIQALFDRVPGLSVVVTSQEVLGMAAEQKYQVDPLALPPPGESNIAGFAAVDLFVLRARSADRWFRLDSSNAAAVADICRRLDGIPLALEMAAALIPKFGIEGVRSRLDKRLHLFSTRPRMGEMRHRTLGALVEWSYGLLTAADRRIFRRFGIFVGSFSVEAAVAIGGMAGEEPWQVEDALCRLIDKSLVTVEPGEAPRYRMLETLRLHAARELRASGESDTIAERHAQYFAAFFDQAGESWEMMPNDEWRTRYGPEIDNVRAALNWALAAPGRAPVGIALAGNSRQLWLDLGLIQEGRHYADRFVGLLDEATPWADAALLLRCAGTMWRADNGRALTLLERSVALLRRFGDRTKLGSVLTQAGNHYYFLGRQAEAESALDEAQTLLTGSHRWKSLFQVMTCLSKVARLKDEPAEAARCLAIALDLARQMKDGKQESLCFMNMGEVEFLRGAIDPAIECASAAVDGIRAARLGGLHLANASNNLASYLAVRGDHAEARRRAEEALSLIVEEGGIVLRICLPLWALIGAGEQRHRAAARLIGWVDGNYERTGEIREHTEQVIRDRLQALLETQLPTRDIASLAAEGAHWSEAAALSFVRTEIVSPVTRNDGPDIQSIGSGWNGRNMPPSDATSGGSLQLHLWH
jgi:predicted ATPase/DNA-binding winged helix-turn-helix (wHTH) protein